MRNKPTYDWDWLESHAPFKKVLEEECGLKIKKKIIDKQSGSIQYKDNQFIIEVSLDSYIRNFSGIKEQLLNTRVCKNNPDIYIYTAMVLPNKRGLEDLIITCCIKNCRGSLQWVWK